jgi:predicted  nucleic acid-binding Zn-ribbon protein
MSAAEPREIRLSEIPTELRNLRDEIERWREAHARQLTRAGELEKEVSALTLGLGKAIYARDAARQTCDDLTDHCERQGKRIESLELSVEAHAADSTAWMRKSQANFGRADKLAEYIEHELEHKGETVADEHVRDLVLAAGVECPECEGKGWEADEEMIPFGGASNGYRTRAIVVDCERCSGLGMVLR